MAASTAELGEATGVAPGDRDDGTVSDTESGGSVIPEPVQQSANAWEEALDWETTDFDADMAIMDAVRMIGGAVIGIAVIVIVVNEVLTTSAVNNSSGPFSGVINSLETTGVSAMVLLVVGLLVAAASKLMSFFGGGF